MPGVLIFAIFAFLVLVALLVPVMGKLTSSPQKDEALRAQMRREQAQRDVALEDEKARIRRARGAGE